MKDMELTWELGIDNISADGDLPPGAVVDAVNLDITRVGGIDRRRGRASVHAANARDIWTSDERRQSFAVIDGVLCQVTMPWTATALFTPTIDAPFSYCDLNGDVLASSRYDLLVIASDMSVRRLGLERPMRPGSDGRMTRGGYGGAVSYLHGNEEGPLSPIAFGTTLSLPVPSEGLVTAIRVYRTQDNGDILYHCTDLPINATTYTFPDGRLGRKATNQYLDRMIPGDFVRAWKGLVWTVRSNVIYHSEPLRYGLYSPRFNFIQMGALVRLFEPVEGGIFVGTKEGIFFLTGSEPKAFSLQKRGGMPPAKGSARRIPLSLLGEQASGEYGVIWLSDNGYVLGMPDGSIIEPQRKRIKSALSQLTCSSVVSNRQITTTVQ